MPRRSAPSQHFRSPAIATLALVLAVFVLLPDRVGTAQDGELEYGWVDTWDFEDVSIEDFATVAAASPTPSPTLSSSPSATAQFDNIAPIDFALSSDGGVYIADANTQSLIEIDKGRIAC